MLSQTVEYALRSMVHLASLPPETAHNSEVIAQRTSVPRGYLSKILRDLVVARLIRSRRGPNGGFTLARAPEDISILDVINAVDPFERIRDCPLGNPAHVQLCPLHRRLDDSMALIESEFDRTALSELVETSAKAVKQCGSLVSPTAKGRRLRRR